MIEEHRLTCRLHQTFRLVPQQVPRHAAEHTICPERIGTVLLFKLLDLALHPLRLHDVGRADGFPLYSG